MRRTVSYFLVLLIGGLLAAGWYAYDKGFTKKWRAFVVNELRKRGFEVSMRKMTLEPWRGIVAKEVKVYDTRDRKRMLGVVDEVRLVINFANFFQGKPFLDALDLKDAHLALPLDPSNPRGFRVQISGLSGRLLLPPHQLYLSRLDAEMYGIRLSATGRLIHPEALKNDHRGANERGALLAAIEELIALLKTIQFEGGPPQLDLRFSGDVAQPERLFVEATFWGEKIRRKGYQLENLYVAASFRDGVLGLRHLIASDAHGVLRASGSYEADEASLRLESNLDLQALTHAFDLAPELDEFVFYKPPHIEITATSNLAARSRWRLLGRLDVGKFAYRSVMFESLHGDFSWDSSRWSARDVRLVHRTGEITGDVMQLPEELRTRFHNSIDQKALAPILSGKTAEWFKRFRLDETFPAPRKSAGLTIEQTAAP